MYIDSISFNDGGTYKLDSNDVIVFTGANNAGKTHTLIEIFHTMKNAVVDKHIIDNFSTKKIGTAEGFLADCIIENNCFIYSNFAFECSMSDYIKNTWNSGHGIVDFTEAFLNYISTETRLSSTKVSSTHMGSHDNQLVEKLYNDDNLEKIISNYFKDAFGESLILDRLTRSTIPIHVGTPPVMNEGEDRISKSYINRLRKLPLLENQGDGMRSFAAILLNVFVGKQSITLIDEPEAFLHPPQAKLLAKMLVNNKPNNKQLFIATHSEEFIKGLLEAANGNIKIFRINREDNVSRVSLLDNVGVEEIWKDPILKYSHIINGLFHSKVILCEADTDCLFYQAMVENIDYGENILKNDILYIHCGGKKRFKTVIKALKSLDVKLVVIADFDILNDAEKDNTFREVTEALGVEWNKLETKRNIIIEYIKTQRAQLETSDVKKQINEILNSVDSEFFPHSKAKAINATVKKASPWSKVKEVGYRFLSGQAVQAYEDLFNICVSAGLFIVPVGELERFYTLCTDHGTKWVNTVLETVDLKNDSHLEEARNFAKKIIDF